MAIIGLIGVFIGSFASLAAAWFKLYLEDKTRKEREKPSRELLKEMLNHLEHTWRKLYTLMHVIGSNEETTKRLLLDLGARASEDGKDLWALKSRAPLSSIDKDKE